MKQAISFDAMLWDLKKIKDRYRYLVEQYWLGIVLLTIWITQSFFHLSLENGYDFLFYGFLAVATFLFLGFRYFQYKAIKEKEIKGEVIFFSPKKNERLTYLYSFIIFCFLAYFCIGGSFFWLSFFLLVAASRLAKYLFYLPSIAFSADGYQLTMLQGVKHKQIDFTYPTKLRFVYNLISFENDINGKVQWKDTNLNKEKIDTLTHFLAENFGREMIVSPSTGQPLT